MDGVHRAITNRLAELIVECGEWTYDIPLPCGVWTRGDLKIPHTRLKRVIQIIKDIVDKPFKQCTILDLGCLDGIYAIEMALHGARVIGIDAREANIKRATFSKDCLGLSNLDLIQEDVRNLSFERYGTYDVILCSGLLYHLNTPDSFLLMEN